MPFVKYVPIDYYSYNRPIYVASVIALIMYFIFACILYSGFIYEWFNVVDNCDPTYYYGKACKNMISKQILMDPQFIDTKRKFYRAKDTINYEFIPKDDKLVKKAEKDIDQNLKMSDTMIESGITNIQSFSENVNTVFQKYLGNMKSLVKDTSVLSKDTMQSFSHITENLKSLMEKLHESIIDPAFEKYSDPLKKLYASLKTTYQSSIPFDELSKGILDKK
jgi:hypothetical protein